MEEFSRKLDILNEKLGHLVKWLALFMMITQFLIVVLRYVYGFTFTWLNDSVMYAHATLFMLGAGFTLLHEGHVRVDIFYAKLSRKNQAIIDMFGYLLFLLPSLLVLVIYTRKFVWNSWKILEGSPVSGGIDAIFWLKTLVPLFAILLLIQGFSGFLRNLAIIRKV